MPTHDYDPETEYRRQRIAAAQEVEVWIHGDPRVLDIFRERITFAAELWDQNERRCKEVGEQQNQVWGPDWEAALADPRRRDINAPRPGPEYKWTHHDKSYTNPPTKEDFEDLCEKGFNGTWEEVKTAWQERRWGYWRRRAPIPTWNPVPWLRMERIKDELHIVSWGDPSETLQAHYAILAAIHDTDLQGVTAISKDVWPDELRQEIHQWLWTDWGDKTDLIRTALRIVRQDLDAEIKGLEGGKATRGNQVPWTDEMSAGWITNTEAITRAREAAREHDLPELARLDTKKLYKLLRKRNPNIRFMSTHDKRPRGRVHEADWNRYLQDKRQIADFIEQQVETEVRKRIS